VRSWASLNEWLAGTFRRGNADRTGRDGRSVRRRSATRSSVGEGHQRAGSGDGADAAVLARRATVIADGRCPSCRGCRALPRGADVSWPQMGTLRWPLTAPLSGWRLRSLRRWHRDGRWTPQPARGQVSSMLDAWTWRSSRWGHHHAFALHVSAKWCQWSPLPARQRAPHVGGRSGPRLVACLRRWRWRPKSGSLRRGSCSHQAPVGAVASRKWPDDHVPDASAVPFVPRPISARGRSDEARADPDRDRLDP